MQRLTEDREFRGQGNSKEHSTESEHSRLTQETEAEKF